MYREAQCFFWSKLDIVLIMNHSVHLSRTMCDFIFAPMEPIWTHLVQDLQSQLLLWLRRPVNFDLAYNVDGGECIDSMETFKQISYGNVMGKGTCYKQIEQCNVATRWEITKRCIWEHNSPVLNAQRIARQSSVQHFLKLLERAGFRNNRSNITKYALIAPYYHVNDVSSAIWVEHRQNRKIGRKGSYKGRNAKNRAGEMTEVVARI